MSVADTTASLVISSHQGQYRVDFLESADAACDVVSVGSDTFVLVDETVLELHRGIFRKLDPVRVFAIRANEENKTLQGVEQIATFLQAGRASKGSTLLVVGGGIVQDLGAFVAHIYYRGIPYVFVPTTLLSMADSCIGAKCGVNLGSYKNQLGFFQSPARVAIWSDFLLTLPADDVRSGFGEVLKLAITAGEEAFAWFERRLQTDGFGIASVGEAIARSLETKRTIIEEDEYERGLRKTLNYGHTFAHALETVTEHEVPHGLAVAWGVDVANYVAMKRAFLRPDLYARIHTLVAANFAFNVRAAYDAARLIAAMKRDKKAAGDSVQLILLSALGQLTVVATNLDETLQRDIGEYLEHQDIAARQG